VCIGELSVRVGKLIGTVTLSRRLADVPPGQFVIVQPESTAALQAAAPAKAEPVVAYDELGAALGGRVAISEGREAAMPFVPRHVPFDVYCAAIMDVVHVDGTT
jgi:microcompartment protein CcmK/EutM